jgi:hypothetical protein
MENENKQNDLYNERKANYEEKRERRIDKYKSRARKASISSEQHRKIADDAVSGIVPGQPILIGHHSEKRHRAALNKCHSHMDKTIEEQDKAAYYFEKAIAAESNTAISSDDPDAINKLQEKIDKLKVEQEFMKKVNREYKKHITAKAKGEKYPMQLTEEEKVIVMESIKRMRSYDRQPYPGFELTSINNKIKIAENRIKQLQKFTANNTENKKYTIEGIPGVEFENNVVENRFKVYTKMGKVKSFELGLPGIFKRLGFIWCGTDTCYQRKLSTLSGYVKASLVEALKEALK